MAAPTACDINVFSPISNISIGNQPRRLIDMGMIRETISAGNQLDQLIFKGLLIYALFLCIVVYFSLA